MSVGFSYFFIEIPQVADFPSMVASCIAPGEGCQPPKKACHRQAAGKRGVSGINQRRGRLRNVTSSVLFGSKHSRLVDQEN